MSFFCMIMPLCISPELHKWLFVISSLSSFKSSYGPYITFNTIVNDMSHSLNVAEIENGSLILLLNLELVIFVSDE